MDTQERVTRLEVLVGGPTSSDDGRTIFEQLQSLTEGMKDLSSRVSDIPGTSRSKDEATAGLLEEFRDIIEALHTDVVLLKQVVARYPQPGLVDRAAEESSVPGRLKVPEPKKFEGARSAKDLGNFIWDMEEYFVAANIPEERQVSLASMFLSGDAKLWYRTRTEEDRSAGRPRMETWNSLKEELREQFLPSNTTWVARDRLKNLRQSGTVREYVQEFSSCLLDIRNMSEEDKLFNFISGLQPWAQVELRQQKVGDLPAALVAADALVDLQPRSGVKEDTQGKMTKGGRDSQREGRRPFRPKRGPDVASGSRDRGPGVPASGCFLCGGPHRAKQCPSRGKVNALVADADQDQEEEPLARASTLQILGALRAERSASEGAGLIYVPCVVNGRAVSALVDTGATHNFVSNGMALELGLKTGIVTSKVKAVNSQARQVQGIARNVGICLGKYEGRVDLMVIELDDFDLILGNPFMRSAGVGVFPQLEGILIANEAGACFVRGQRGSSGVKCSTVREEHLSAMQVTRECTGDLTGLAGVVMIQPDQVVRVPDLLVDAESTELPMGSSERTIVHQIELVPGRVPAPAH